MSVSDLNADCIKTRPDTRLPKSRAGGKGRYFKSMKHLGRNSKANALKKKKEKKNIKNTRLFRGQES